MHIDASGHTWNLPEVGMKSLYKDDKEDPNVNPQNTIKHLKEVIKQQAQLIEKLTNKIPQSSQLIHDMSNAVDFKEEWEGTQQLDCPVEGKNWTLQCRNPEEIA